MGNIVASDETDRYETKNRFHLRVDELRKIKRNNQKKMIRSFSENGAVENYFIDDLRKKNTLKIIHFNSLTEARRLDLGRKKEGNNSAPNKNISSSNCFPGAARFVHEINKERKDKINPLATSTLTLFSGGASGRSILSSQIDKGKHMAHILNRMKVDIGTFGNHEFDFGSEALEKFINLTKFPWICSNVINQKTQKPLMNAEESCYIDYIDGLRIGFIGLVEEDWIKSLPDYHKNNWEYKDFVDCARETASNLITVMKCNFIIALTHMKWCNDERLQKLVPEIDLILGGHDLDLEVRAGKHYCRNSKNFPLIIKSGCDFKSYSVIKVFLSELGNADVQVEQKYINFKGEQDNKIEADLDTLCQKLKKVSNKPLFKLDRSIDVTRKTLGTEECCFGVYISEFVRKYTNADIALVDAAAFSGNLHFNVGHLFTKGDIFKIFPLMEKIIVFECPGEVLLAALNNSASKLPEADGRFLQVSGLRFKYSLDPKVDPNRRVHANKVFIETSPRKSESGNPTTRCRKNVILDRKKKYTVACREEIKNGFLGYECLKPCREYFDREDPNNIILSMALIHFLELLKKEVSLLNKNSADKPKLLDEITSVTGKYRHTSNSFSDDPFEDRRPIRHSLTPAVTLNKNELPLFSSAMSNDSGGVYDDSGSDSSEDEDDTKDTLLSCMKLPILKLPQCEGRIQALKT